MDKAGWHTSGDLVVPENLSRIFLPPYSPDARPRADPRRTDFSSASRCSGMRACDSPVSDRMTVSGSSRPQSTCICAGSGG
jgi:hypothetical protein